MKVWPSHPEPCSMWAWAPMMMLAPAASFGASASWAWSGQAWPSVRSPGRRGSGRAGCSRKHRQHAGHNRDHPADHHQPSLWVPAWTAAPRCHLRLAPMTGACTAQSPSSRSATAHRLDGRQQVAPTDGVTLRDRHVYGERQPSRRSGRLSDRWPGGPCCARTWPPPCASSRAVKLFDCVLLN